MTARVRRDVEAELAAEQAELVEFAAATAAALEDREDAVAAREREASPPYRASLVTAGALLAVWADLVIRTVA